MKIKPILPSLREKKRYLAFEVVSKARIRDFATLKTAILTSLSSFLGVFNMAKAGTILLEDTWDRKKQRGLIRVNHRYVDDVKFALMRIDKIKRQSIIIRRLGVSGILKKAYNRYIAT